LRAIFEFADRQTASRIKQGLRIGENAGAAAEGRKPSQIIGKVRCLGGDGVEIRTSVIRKPVVERSVAWPYHGGRRPSTVQIYSPFCLMRFALPYGFLATCMRHAAFDVQCGRTRAIANPIEGGQFNPRLVVELEFVREPD